MGEIVYLNNIFQEKETAKISPNDRGFIFADGVYEVVKYYNGKAFRFEDHYSRLERSLKEVGIQVTDLTNLESIFAELLVRNNKQNKHAGIYLQISRGAAQRVHHFPEDIQPTVYAFAFDLPSFTEKHEKGIKVITREDIRWNRCDIKSVSLLPNTMLYNEAVNDGAGECVLIRDKFVTEATHSSLLAIKDGVLITRPLSNFILPGITRKVVLELCRENDIPVEEKLFTKQELLEMDEVFIAGTGSEITPVVQIDNHQVGNGEPGNITRTIQKRFFETVPQ